LNLAVSSYVHIFEPQWNPMVESQAVARVVRLGQKKKVTISRYIVEVTVEQVDHSHVCTKVN
jgi:SWI/SNF-related matrix-associated actin-dependent regulator of chromatin subfamily A3